ncbi:uncharacterized protein SPSC_02434 [Sporisorium scitamineum]|uniref:TM7S3/TM198-like domain-containing protein n=1 Tax=Sporisorium scitamineum TaxID=49012 RepID=A0A0F7S5L8_9BASI|nr:uncharacterized protein SPSC_02434 [Sporisorium scitamineum]CDW94532.1 hypothetical protein [Sporisorium scitamineum]
MLITPSLSKALGFGLLALQVCLAQAQEQPAQPSSTLSSSGAASSTGPTSTSAAAPSSTTVVSTITTTLSRGQSLPTSLTASASSSGSVWYIPVTTAIPVISNATSASASSSAPAATTTANATASASQTSADNALPLHTIIDPAFGVLGVILIIVGLPMAFYGHRNRWSSYFLSGFFALALICISIILKVGVEPAVNPPSKAIRGLFLVAAVIAGAVGGIISIVFWRSAGLFACGLGGFFFGLFLQAVRSGGLIRPVGLRFILYVGLYAVFFTASCIERIHSLVLAFSTAIIGATALTLGIDCYSTQGLKEFYVRNLGFDSLFNNKYPPTFQNGHFPLMQGMQIELGVLGALILMGFAFQMRLWSDLRTQLSALKRSDERRNMRSKAERAARAVARTAKRDLQEWEARHGYNKTASRNVAGKDEESGLAPASISDLKGSRSRTSSFMTLFRANTEATQMPTPSSNVERFIHSPAPSSALDNSAYPFPAQATGRRSAQFLDYIQKGPERVETEGPLRLDLPALTSPLGDLGSSPVAQPAPALGGGPVTPVDSFAAKAPPESTNVSAPRLPQSLDLMRAASSEASTGTESFRRRSASTAALMDNSAGFLDLASKTEQTNLASITRPVGAQEVRSPNNLHGRSQSLGLTSGSVFGAGSANWNGSSASVSHERTFSNPMPPSRLPSASSVPMVKSSSLQDQMQHNVGTVYSQPYVEPHVEPYAQQQRQAQTQQQHRPSISPTNGALKMVSGGESSAVTQARRSLAMRRSDQPAVPWTNPGAEDARASHKRSASAETPSRMRAMSIEELEARHRAKLAALQAPATQTVQDADALRRAKEEWERKQRSERRRMQEREAQKTAAAAAAGSASNGRVASPVQSSLDLNRMSGTSSREERRRSRNLSANLLKAVGEEAREGGGGVIRAAEWRKSISNVEQLDPRAAKLSNPGTPNSTRPTSPQPASVNPFPVQSQQARPRLSETDRRRLSQGAGDRSQRRNSQPLLDFQLPGRTQ